MPKFGSYFLLRAAAGAVQCGAWTMAACVVKTASALPPSRLAGWTGSQQGGGGRGGTLESRRFESQATTGTQATSALYPAPLWHTHVRWISELSKTTEPTHGWTRSKALTSIKKACPEGRDGNLNGRAQSASGRCAISELLISFHDEVMTPDDNGEGSPSCLLTFWLSKGFLGLRSDTHVCSRACGGFPH